MIAAALAVALMGCETGPSRLEVELDAAVADARQAMQAARERRPAYQEMCRAQMPTVSEDAVRTCARRMVLEDLERIDARTMRRMDSISEMYGTRRIQPVRIVP